MRQALNTMLIDGTIVIGEGDAAEADMLYIGERVGAGKGGPFIDIALDPLEGATICAKGGHNALAVMAMAERGSFLSRARRLYGQDRRRPRSARRRRGS